MENAITTSQTTLDAQGLMLVISAENLKKLEVIFVEVKNANNPRDVKDRKLHQLTLVALCNGFSF